MAKRLKYGNKKATIGKMTVDSKLEKSAYLLLKKLGIPFEYQVWHVLVPGFKYNGETIKPIRMRIDFVIDTPRGKVVLDTKGFATETAKIKYKMLKYQQMMMRDECDFVDIVWKDTKKNTTDFIIGIYGEIKNQS